MLTATDQKPQVINKVIPPTITSPECQRVVEQYRLFNDFCLDKPRLAVSVKHRSGVSPSVCPSVSPVRHTQSDLPYWCPSSVCLSRRAYTECDSRGAAARTRPAYVSSLPCEDCLYGVQWATCFTLCMKATPCSAWRASTTGSTCCATSHLNRSRYYPTAARRAEYYTASFHHKMW